MDKHIYCENAEYQDNDYICRYTGKPCTISPIPNKYMCIIYDRYKKYNVKLNMWGGEYYGSK